VGLAKQLNHGAGAVPVLPGERINSLDALRGLALFGVLAINLETEFRVSIFRQFLPREPETGIERHVDAFLQIFLDLKALAVFSLLFGIGLAIQYERLDGNPRRSVLLVRRLLALLIFGVVHLFLIWNGDILTEYAIAGLIALPLLFGPTWTLGVAAAACLLFYVANLRALLIGWPDQVTLASYVNAANRIYGSGDFRQILAFRIEEVKSFLPLHFYIFPRTLGLFLLGAFAWRLGIVRNAKSYAPELWLAGVLGVGIGVVLTLATDARWYSGLRSLGSAEQSFAPFGTIVLALGYASLVFAAGANGTSRFLRWIAPLGRMAFTNYIIQSLVLGWIFYGYGLGQFGKLGLVTGLLLVFAIYISQVLFSIYWLKRFRYGPLEWLWRSLMYGQPPRFRPNIQPTEESPNRA
jgi:uncharacterized protein